MKRLYPLDKAMMVYLCFLRMMWKMEGRELICESVPLGIPVHDEHMFDMVHIVSLVVVK
jgi:hypothetical protein